MFDSVVTKVNSPTILHQQVYGNILENPLSETSKETVALTGVENVYFPEMKKWILAHIQGMPIVIASQTEDNWLMAEVLSVLALLVKYGYYDDPDDVNAVLRPLVDVLNGFEDLPFPESEDQLQGLANIILHAYSYYIYYYW